MSTVPTPNRGETWLVDFDPSVGAEIQKVRPALVISEDSIGRLPLRMVVPLTDWKPQYAGFPWFVFIPVDAGNGLSKDSGGRCVSDEVGLPDALRPPAGVVTAAQLDAVAAAVALCVGAPWLLTPPEPGR